MSSWGKMQKFISLAKAHEWTGSYEYDEKTDRAELTLKRNGEVLVIGWEDNSILGPPQYDYSGTHANLHSAAVAERTIVGKPNLALITQRMRRQQPKTDEEIAPELLVQQELPFDKSEATDKEILVACRGATLLYRNSISGTPGYVHIDPNKNRNFNKLQPVYYMSESSGGRRIINFIDGGPGGAFRAIGIDTILQVS